MMTRKHYNVYQARVLCHHDGYSVVRVNASTYCAVVFW